MGTIAAPAYTPADLLRMGSDGRAFELVDGELRELTVSKESSRSGVKVARHLDVFCEAHDLGWVYGSDLGFRCFADDPNRVRKPDVAFVSLDRMPAGGYEDEGFCTACPDLVAEVISPNDLAYEVDAKADEWLAAGVREVWIVNPETRAVRVQRADGGVALVRAAGTLTTPLLPGFAVPVAALFRRPSAPPPAGVS